MPELVIGQEPIRVDGPATLVHEGGDLLRIREFSALPGNETTLAFEGEVKNDPDHDEEFVPYGESKRSLKIEEGVFLTALGQANVRVDAPKPEKKVKEEKEDA